MQIILSDFMSVDGRVQAPLGPDEDTDGGLAQGGWSVQCFDPEVMGSLVQEVMDGTDALLFGRRTWEGVAAAWAGRAGDPYADQLNAVTKYVVSRTLTREDLHWPNSILLDPDDAIGAVRELRERDGGSLQISGSPSLASELIWQDLVDMIMIMIEPTTLGDRPIFPMDDQARPLKLESATTIATGAVICTHRPSSR